MTDTQREFEKIFGKRPKVPHQSPPVFNSKETIDYYETQQLIWDAKLNAWQAALAHSQQNKEPIKPDNVLQGYWDKAMAGYRFVITNRKDE